MFLLRLGHCGLEVFKSQLKLVGVQLLGSRAEPSPLHLLGQMLEPGVQRRQFGVASSQVRVLGIQMQARGPLRGKRRDLRFDRLPQLGRKSLKEAWIDGRQHGRPYLGPAR